MPDSWHAMPTMMDQVAALREFFKPPSEAPLPMQVAMMNQQMGIAGEGALPKHVDELCRLIGWKADAVVQPEHVAVGVPVDGAQPAVAPPVGAPPADENSWVLLEVAETDDTNTTG